MRWPDFAFWFWRKPLVTKRRHRPLGTRDTIWFRPIRTLLDSGVPAMPITYLLIDVAANRSHPIGALCKTEKGRLIFWPLLTTGLRSRITKDQLIDHITLELASGHTHRTGYEQHRPWHDDRESKIVPVDNYPLSFWFANGVDWNAIRHEPLMAQTWAKTPKSDEERRKAEFKEFASKAVFIRLPPQDRPPGESFLLSYFYLVYGDIEAAEAPNPLFPSLQNLIPNIGDQTIPFRGSVLHIGDIALIWTCGWIGGSIQGSTLIVPNLGN